VSPSGARYSVFQSTLRVPWPLFGTIVFGFQPGPAQRPGAASGRRWPHTPAASSPAHTDPP
jgi:hypothetical protein